MAEKAKRLSKVAKELNVGVSTIVDFLASKGVEITSNPNAKIEADSYQSLLEKFQPDMLVKQKKEEAKVQAEKDRAEFLKHDIARKQVENKPVLKPNLTPIPKDSLSETEVKAPDKPEPKSIINLQDDKKVEEKEKSVEEAKVKTEIQLPSTSQPKKEEDKVQETKPVEVVEEKSMPETISKEKPQDQIPTTDVVVEISKVDDKPKETVKVDEPVQKEQKTEPVEKPIEATSENADNSVKKEDSTSSGLKVIGKIDLDSISDKKKPSSNTNKDHKPKSHPKKTENKGLEKSDSKPDTKSIEPKSEEKITNQHKEESVKNLKETEVKHLPKTESKQSKEVSKPEVNKVEQASKPTEKHEKPKENELKGLTVLGKIDLNQFKKKKPQPVASTSDPDGLKKKKRKRKKIANPKAGGSANDKKPNTNTQSGGGQRGPGQGSQNRSGGQNRGNDRRGPARRPVEKKELDDKQIQAQIKDTLNRLTNKDKQGNKTRLKKKKKEIQRQRAEEQAAEIDAESKVIQVTEFITANDLASLMDVSVTEIITACMSLGLMVSINQRIDAETISIVADEFGYEARFKDVEMDEPSLEEADNVERYKERAPIVTIMGHVDHGKTSLLDYIRKSNVIAGEAGGITQHIGAYEVTLDNGKQITFLDTPGHEAFTAMRSRGAKITDVVIVVIAADDRVMPQTKEAISHAQAAGVPMVFAINKVDREASNAEFIKQQLSEMDILVEDWGGKYQSQEISAKTGLNVNELLEKVLLEAEMLDLKADAEKRGVGTIIESSLDKGRGMVATVLVQSGTLRVGDNILAGAHAGKVKAMFNERGQRVKEVGPSSPVQLLGFDGATTAGDKFYVTKNEAEAKQFANERSQLIREQGIRTTKHITLDEIGRRIAIGTFKELNVIVKGDVDGSVEALADSLLKLSTEEIQVNVIHKGVGQISETDVLLASASDAIIIGFQVRPSANARNTAEKEQIDIRLYSVIYKAIEELKQAMEGMLEPTQVEKIVGTVDIRETFKISKVGTIAGCYVTSGKINRNSKVRLIREGVVKWEGELASLKRFKDDVKEVNNNYECGLNLAGYNDIKVGDYIEAYEFVEVKRKL